MLYKLLRQYLEKIFFEEEMKIVFFLEKMLLIHDGTGSVISIGRYWIFLGGTRSVLGGSGRYLVPPSWWYLVSYRVVHI